MKIGIIGSGFVGATTAYAIVMKGVAGEVVLVDINHERSQAEAADIMHAVPYAHPAVVRAGTYDDLADATVIIITAGVGQKENETRLELLERNAGILWEMVDASLRAAPEAVLVIATNPVDILTHLATRYAAKYNALPGQVFGSGTTLDTARFRSLLGNQLKIDSQHVHGYVIGEHGDSEVLAWSTVEVGGLSLNEFTRLRKMPLRSAERKEIENSVRYAAYQIIAAKKATYYGIGAALANIVSVIVSSRRSIMTVCCPTKQICGVHDISLSLPRLVGRRGIIETLPLKLSDKESAQLKESAKLIRQTLDELH